MTDKEQAVIRAAKRLITATNYWPADGVDTSGRLQADFDELAAAVTTAEADPTDEELAAMSNDELLALLNQGDSAIVNAIEDFKPEIFKCSTGGYLVAGIHGGDFRSAVRLWIYATVERLEAKRRPH